ncbi:MAG: hypothetical protein AB7L41_00095 [Flavobacteriaceae bacterium]
MTGSNSLMFERFSGLKALVLICAGALLAGCSSSEMAGFDGGSASKAAFDPLVSLGLAEPDKPEIEYKPRAPLVMPPSTALQQPHAASVDRGPQWPNDPDAQARAFEERRKEAAKKDDRYKDVNRERANRVLSPQQLEQWAANAGQRGRYQHRDGETMYIPNEAPSRTVSPGEMAAGAGAPPADLPQTVYAEPEREYLSDPPVGFRQPAPDSVVPIKQGPAIFTRDTRPTRVDQDFKPE